MSADPLIDRFRHRVLRWPAAGIGGLRAAQRRFAHLVEAALLLPAAAVLQSED